MSANLITFSRVFQYKPRTYSHTALSDFTFQYRIRAECSEPTEHRNGTEAQYTTCFKDLLRTRAVRKVSSHFEYLQNQPVRGDLTVHP